MKRAASSDLKKWYTQNDRKPLILRGARQVGKSTLVKLFAAENGLDLIEVNLELKKISSLKREGLTVQDILDEVSLTTRKKIGPNTLLFFDEIQEQPELIRMLRYFYEQRPDVCVICAGSLLEFVLKDTISFPVGRVEFYHLGPMSFTEFLLATGQDIATEKLGRLEFSEALHNLLLEEFRKYLFVGGMPAAVKAYAVSNSLSEARHIQDQILQTYAADFPKYNSRIKADRISKVFQSSALTAGQKLIFKKLDSESQSRDIRRVVELLQDARVLLPCSHSEGASVPLIGQADLSIQKNYFLDIGLLSALLRIDLDLLENEMRTQFQSKGILAEQFVAQHLQFFEGHSLQPQLFYFLRDKGIQKGEVDFLIQHKSNVIPVEVKGSAAGHLKSLFYYCAEKKKSFAIRLSLSSFRKDKIQHKIKDHIVEVDLMTIPIYAVDLIRELIEQRQRD